jgi:trk system potassium uptake protein TrkA
MKIVILGAGQVGASVADHLSREANDITIVDIDNQRLRELQDRLDIRSVLGHAAHPSTLMRAGIEDADLVIALTNSDESNMAACQVAYSLFKTPTKIARIRASEYLEHPALFSPDDCPIDVLISPEQLVTKHVQRLIEYPGALQVLDFADGKAQLVAMRAKTDGPLVGHHVWELRRILPKGVESRVAAIFRGTHALIPDGGTLIEENDVLFFLAEKKDIKTLMAEMRRLENPVRRVILAGGGNIGLALAKALERDHHVKIFERRRERATLIAESLEKAIVLAGDASDEDLLREESIDLTDVYCALTDDDEANILSSMLAKRLGARKVITLINRPAYTKLIESDMIDIAVSPQQVTMGALLTHVRKGHMVRVHSLRQGAAEAIEAVAHGDSSSSNVVGRTIEKIGLPKGTTIGGIIRAEKLVIAHHDTTIETDDHIILFVLDKAQIPAIERLFQVEAAFV